MKNFIKIIYIIIFIASIFLNLYYYDFYDYLFPNNLVNINNELENINEKLDNINNQNINFDSFNKNFLILTISLFAAFTLLYLYKNNLDLQYFLQETNLQLQLQIEREEN
jgi:uncharacterized protein YxeA